MMHADMIVIVEHRRHGYLCMTSYGDDYVDVCV